MDDEITGVNTGMVKMQIEELYRVGVTIGMDKVNTAISDLFSSLSMLWYSPNAVRFYNDYADYMLNLVDNATKEIIKLCRNAAHAYNVAATVHGLGSISFDVAFVFYAPYYKLMEVGPAPNYKQGMDLYRVGLALDEFKTKVIAGLSCLESLPSTISLYDPGSEQRKMFLITLVAIKEQISGDVQSMIDRIESSLKSEKNAIFTAANESASILAG